MLAFDLQIGQIEPPLEPEDAPAAPGGIASKLLMRKG
jgi:hypothetical protein